MTHKSTSRHSPIENKYLGSKSDYYYPSVYQQKINKLRYSLTMGYQSVMAESYNDNQVGWYKSVIPALWESEARESQV